MNLLVIENYSDRVLIRAACNNLSKKDKASLIRYLAAEGYIHENYATLAGEQLACGLRIKWLTDDSLLKELTGKCLRRRFSQLIRVIIWVGLFSLVLVALALVR